MYDLITTTQEIHYENYRTRRLSIHDGNTIQHQQFLAKIKLEEDGFREKLKYYYVYIRYSIILFTYFHLKIFFSIFLKYSFLLYPYFYLKYSFLFKISS